MRAGEAQIAARSSVGGRDASHITGSPPKVLPRGTVAQEKSAMPASSAVARSRGGARGETEQRVEVTGSRSGEGHG